MRILGKDYKQMTRCEGIQLLADGYTLLAVRLARHGEPDLATFYVNVARGFLLRLRQLTVGQCEELLA